MHELFANDGGDGDCHGGDGSCRNRNRSGSSGIGLGLMRHTIGQSDMTPGSIGEWSFDSNGGQPDPQLKYAHHQTLSSLCCGVSLCCVPPEIVWMASERHWCGQCCCCIAS